MNAIKQERFDFTLAILLTTLVVVSAIMVTKVMFAPSDRDAVIAALSETGEEILAAAKTYPDRAHLFNSPSQNDSATITQTSEGSSPESGPFTGLRFDRIGYFDRLSPDARTYHTETGRFSLQVSPDGQSFTLTAYGPEEVSIQWHGRVEEIE